VRNAARSRRAGFQARRNVRGPGTASGGDGICHSSKREPGTATVARDALRPSRRTLRCSGFVALRGGERENPSSWRHRPDDRRRDQGRPRRFRRKGRQGVEDAQIADGGMNPALVVVKAVVSSMALRANDGAFKRVGKRHAVCHDRRKKSLEKVDVGERYDEDLAAEALVGSPRPSFVRNSTHRPFVAAFLPAVLGCGDAPRCARRRQANARAARAPFVVNGTLRAQREWEQEKS